MNAKYEVTSPEQWLIEHRASGQMLVDAWFDHKRGQWCAEFDNSVDDAMKFPTREAAVAAFKSYRLDPKKVGLRHVLATVKLSDEAKADVLARRAARNADRKF